jgi:hypothetical protein
MVVIHMSKEIEHQLNEYGILYLTSTEPEFWHGTKSVKKINKKEGKVIEREVVIAFKNSVCREIVTLDPKKSVKKKITDGAMKGTKDIIITAIADNKTRVDVQWDINVKGFFGMFTWIIKKQFRKDRKTP